MLISRDHTKHVDLQLHYRYNYASFDGKELLELLENIDTKKEWKVSDVYRHILSFEPPRRVLSWIKGSKSSSNLNSDAKSNSESLYMKTSSHTRRSKSNIGCEMSDNTPLSPSRVKKLAQQFGQYFMSPVHFED